MNLIETSNIDIDLVRFHQCVMFNVFVVNIEQDSASRGFYEMSEDFIIVCFDNCFLTRCLC